MFDLYKFEYLLYVRYVIKNAEMTAQHGTM
jgi:hypothetical protein